MGDLGSAKTLGGVGAILMLVGVFVPFLSIVGLILVYLGVKNISEVINVPKIKSDFIMFVVLSIIAVILVFAAPFIAFGGFGLFTSIDYSDPIGAVGSSIAICLVIWIIAVIFYILSAIYLKKSFDSIAQNIQVDMFRTTGLVYLIGAILIIIGIGLIILFIASILMIIAFFSIPDQVAPTQAGGQPGPGQPAYPQQPQQTGRICPNCGRPIPMDAQVCPYCGKDFRQQ